MLERKPIFPHVIELNHQAGEVLGCNVYLIYDENEWIIIDIGYEETVDEIVELIRQLDFPLSRCKMIVATHADVDHVQGLAKLKSLLRAPVAAHPLAAGPLTKGDKLLTFAEIDAQNIHMEMPPVEIDKLLNEGDVVTVGNVKLDVWLTPGHTHSQLCFRHQNLLFSGDNIYRDGGVGAIDAHHGSHIPKFIKSLTRIRDCDAEWLLPAHGPVFRKDNALIDRALGRLETYLHLPDFGTCAIDWPLMDDYEKELADGKMPLD